MALGAAALSSLWLLIGTVAGRVATLAANVLAARLLGAEVFGQFMTIRATIGAIENVFTGSIGNITVKEVSQRVGDAAALRTFVSRVVTLAACASLLGGMVILAVAAHLTSNNPASYSQLFTSFVLGCPLLGAVLFSAIVVRIAIGLTRFRANALMGITAASLSIPVIYYLTSNYGIYGALSALIVYFVLDASLKSMVLAKSFSTASAGARHARIHTSAHALLKASAPLAVATGISAATLWGARVLVATWPNGFVEIAYFDAAYQVFMAMMVMTGATTAVALQMFSASKSALHGNKKTILKTHLLMNGVLLSAISIGVIGAAEQIMGFFGPEYAAHYHLVSILCVVAFLATAASVCEKLFISAASFSCVIAANGLGAISAVLTIWFVNSTAHSMVLAMAHLAYFLGTTAFYGVTIHLRRAALFHAGT